MGCLIILEKIRFLFPCLKGMGYLFIRKDCFITIFKRGLLVYPFWKKWKGLLIYLIWDGPLSVYLKGNGPATYLGNLPSCYLFETRKQFVCLSRSRWIIYLSWTRWLFQLSRGTWVDYVTGRRWLTCLRYLGEDGPPGYLGRNAFSTSRTRRTLGGFGVHSTDSEWT